MGRGSKIKLKIVKISANFPPKRCGIGDYTRYLSEKLVELDKDIFIYIVTSSDRAIKESGYSYERIKLLPAIKAWSFPCLSQIEDIIKEISPDIIHIEFNRSFYGRKIAMNFLPCFLKRKSEKHKIIMTFHDLPGPLKSRDPFFWLTSLSALSCCDKIIVTNDVDFNNFLLRFPFVKKKCTLLPVGSNIPRFEGNPALIKKELNISDDTLILCFFGFIREDKYFSRLFYAFRELLRKGRKLKLLVMGGIRDKDIYSHLHKLIHKLNISGEVIRVDYRPERKVSELLRVSDIAVLPYRNGISTNSSAFSACVLHNLPIVTTKAKFMPEIIRNDYNLMLVNPNSTEELTNVLFVLTGDEALRNKLSKNLKELGDYLSWQRISKQILKLYNELNKKCQ